MAATAVPKALEKIRVLVVEDHPETRLALSKGLEARGAIVDSVDNADEALREVDDFVPDVIVSDIAMPEQDGIQFISELRSKLQRNYDVPTPAVAVTGLPEWVVQQHRRRGIFDVILRKPCELQTLTSVVASLARRATAAHS